MLALKHLFTFLPAERLDVLAGRYQIDAAHSVKLSGPALFLCLLNGLLNHPHLSQRLLEETYHQQTGDTLDHSSFSYALNRMPVAYFADVFGELYQKLQPKTTPGTTQALKVRRVDATTVTLSAKLLTFGLAHGNRTPDKARRGVKSVLELSQDGLPQLLKVCQNKADKSDCVAVGDAMLAHTQPGDLWVFDKGCHDRHRLLALHQAGSFWLTPHSTQALREQALLWQRETALPTHAPLAHEPDFVLVRVTQATFGNTQDNAQEQAAWEAMPLVVVHGWRWDQRAQAWKPLTLMSNLPLSHDKRQVGPYTWEELAALYRSRWDIEVFFKFVKQHLSFSHLVSRQQNGITIMIYMSLIAALLLIWYKEQTGIDRGWRSVKFWLAEDVRRWTQELLQTTRIVDDD